LRGRFSRKEKPSGGRNREDVRRRGRYEVREARWYEPHYFDPEPINWKSGAISFVAAFAAFIAAGQLGLWATGVIDAGSLTFTHVLGPFMPVLYTLVGLVTAYFAYRAAGYAALALVFVAVLAVGSQGLPQGLLQFGALGIVLLLVVIWLGSRRERGARSR
jgi:molecular chaperone DnaJ